LNHLTSLTWVGLFASLLARPALAQTDYPRPYLYFPISKTALDPKDIVQVHNYVFGKGGGQDLHAEIAYPKNAAKPLPAIIYIHGGGWYAGDLHQGDVMGLARNGYFGVSIEYRLSDAAKWPAQIQDCKCAVRWLRANAGKFNVDPNRIGVWGASAGGHLVACVGTMTGPEYEGDGGWPGVSSAVQAVCDMCGPTDLTRTDITGDFLLKCQERLLGCTLQQNPAAWKNASPFYDVKAGDPPFLIIQGDSDKIVNPQQATIFDAALTKAGVPHQLLVVKNGGHEYASESGRAVDPSIHAIQQAIAYFFDEHLKPN
jgi:acetyl esterase/lipase